MTIQPKAKNGLNTSLLYENRLYYKLGYPTQYENNIDLWNNSTLYGKVDLNVDVVYLNPNNLKAINNKVIGKQKVLYACSFVVDAYEEMLEEFRRADQYQKIPKSNLNPIIVKKASLIAEEQYKDRMLKILDVLLKKDLQLMENKIITFDDYLRLLINNFSITRLPLSQTANIFNTAFSPNTTGLMLELSNLEHDDDEKKVLQYLNDVNYQFFINTAEKYSFYVDKNAPWRLIFNVNTQYALDKFKTYGANSLQEMFDKLYLKSYTTDYKLLKDNIVKYYNNNVLKKETTQIYNYDCFDDSLNFTTVIKQSGQQLERNDLFWIKFYYFVRLQEQKINLTQKEFDNKLFHLISIYKSAGEQQALSWINQQTKFVVDGGANPDYNEFVRLKKAEAAKHTSYVLKI
jgi:hypothetical protein